MTNAALALSAAEGERAATIRAELRKQQLELVRATPNVRLYRPDGAKARRAATLNVAGWRAEHEARGGQASTAQYRCAWDQKEITLVRALLERYLQKGWAVLAYSDGCS